MVGSEGGEELGQALMESAAVAELGQQEIASEPQGELSAGDGVGSHWLRGDFSSHGMVPKEAKEREKGCGPGMGPPGVRMSLRGA